MEKLDPGVGVIRFVVSPSLRPGTGGAQYSRRVAWSTAFTMPTWMLVVQGHVVLYGLVS